MYQIPWKLICDHWFHAVFDKTIIRQRKKYWRNRTNTIRRMFTAF